MGWGWIFIIGGVKASGLMTKTLEGIIPHEHITVGLVTCNSGGFKTHKVQVIEASHPVPDEKGIRGNQEMLALKKSFNIGEGDFVICLISGGRSFEGKEFKGKIVKTILRGDVFYTSKQGILVQGGNGRLLKRQGIVRMK